MKKIPKRWEQKNEENNNNQMELNFGNSATPTQSLCLPASSPSEQQQQHEASTSSIWIWLKEEKDLSSSQVKGNVRHRVADVSFRESDSFQPKNKTDPHDRGSGGGKSPRLSCLSFFFLNKKKKKQKEGTYLQHFYVAQSHNPVRSSREKQTKQNKFFPWTKWIQIRRRRR